MKTGELRGKEKHSEARRNAVKQETELRAKEKHGETRKNTEPGGKKNHKPGRQEKIQDTKYL